MDVIDLLERIGRDAALRRAPATELRRALAAMDVRDGLITAVMAANDRDGKDGQPPYHPSNHINIHQPPPPKPDDDAPDSRPSR